jgi:hypothetical protein
MALLAIGRERAASCRRAIGMTKAPASSKKRRPPSEQLENSRSITLPLASPMDRRLKPPMTTWVRKACQAVA